MLPDLFQDQLQAEVLLGSAGGATSRKIICRWDCQPVVLYYSHLQYVPDLTGLESAEGPRK